MHRGLSLVLCLALAACGGSGEDLDAAVSQDAADAGATPDTGLEPDSGLEPDAGEADAGDGDAGVVPGTWTEVEAVLRAKCSPCHDPNNMNNRTVVRQYDRIVGQLSGRYVLVQPGDAQASFLFAKVNNQTNAFCAAQTPARRDCGGIMPPGPTRRPLEPAEVELIRSWIEAGALEN